MLLAVFTLELETDYPSETSLCTVAIRLYFVHANEFIKANYHKYNQQLFHECELDIYEMIIANSGLRASFGIYFLISNAHSWNNC